jgi:hypothetical protein
MAATDRALSQMFRSAILPLIQPQLEFQAEKNANININLQELFLQSFFNFPFLEFLVKI